MNRFLVFLIFAISLFGLWACTADYDTFSKSHYKAFNGIAFDEQDGEPSVYSEEHLIKVTLVAPPESLSTWDSVTVASFDVSSLASIHLVDGKFKEFPSDSAALDSLANDVSYASEKIHVGDKIRIPKSLVVYIMVVAENGDPSIWQMSFTIPGVEVPSSSSSDDKPGSDNPNDDNPGDESSSSSSDEAEKTESSSSAALSDNNDFKISFKDELENETSGDTIYVTFAQGTDLSKVSFETSEIHRSAKIDSDPAKVTDWSKVQKFVVTAEDGTERNWIVVVQAVLSSATDFQIWFKNQLKVNRNEDTIAVKLQNSETIAAAVVDSFKVSAGASVSPNPKDVKWAESQKFTVTAEDRTEKTWVLTLDVAAADEVASDEKELISISAKGEIEAATVDAEKKTIVVHLADQRAVSAVELTVKISETASQDLQAGVLDLRSPVVMTITAEDASTAVWTISADFPLSSEADIKTFALDGVATESAPEINASKHEISFEVAYGTDLSEVFFTATYSDYAKGPAAADCHLDLTSGSGKIEVTAQDGSKVEWTVKVTVGEAPVIAAPEIVSIAVGSAKVSGIIDASAGTISFEMDYAKDVRLDSLPLASLKLSDGATVENFEVGKSYDFAKTKTVVVKNGNGETKTYKLKAGYQYPSMKIASSSWVKDDNGNLYDLSGWDNGNNGFTKQLAVSTESGEVLKMATTKYMGKIASGNTFTAYFNPKNVNAISMLSYKDGNELIDFGRPFYGRPEYVEFDVMYEGKGDSCDLYIVLESRRTAEGNIRLDRDGRNQYRASTDVQTLVASAWYRSTSVEDKTLPDVVSITDAKRAGYKTIRMKLKYGVPLEGSPLYQSSTFNAKLNNSAGIDNHLVQTESPDDFSVTHLRLVMAASANGNTYVGVEGATLYVDEIRLIY
ncbi:MAG: PCMD domain-containing protein [Fibrobacter sp.]|nr:PCMD domain-containing protein [Fibrobacter sp.]